MPDKTQTGMRRSDALSKERIVQAAIEILDTEGESALTFRSLAAHLSTGSGALYWHVADKNALLSAATDSIISQVLIDVASDALPQQEIRAIAVGVFDAFDIHPWVGAQLAREPWGLAMPRLFESIGEQLHALGVPQKAHFAAASALVNYILGVAGQNAANARLLPSDMDRTAFLANVAAQWTQLDPSQYPFVHQVATQLSDHDDREQFLAGIDLILAGIGTVS